MEEFWLINMEGMIEIEDYHFVTLMKNYLFRQ